MSYNEKWESRIYWLLLVLLLVALFLNLGVQPIFLEEPRRALVAMEMMERGNWWVPYQLGEFYYRKPPVFNVVLIIFANIFGGFSEFSQRLVTVLSLLGIGGLIFTYGRRFVNAQLGILSASFFIISGGILFFFAMLGEIDIFYTLITLAGILPIYPLYKQGKFYQLFAIVYFFGAIGMLTKGLSSIVFIGFSLLGWFLYKRNFKKLFHLSHFTGVGIFILVVGGYLFIYSQYNELVRYLQTLWGQSSERTVIDQGFAPLLGHLINFPLDLIKDTLPGSLLLLFAIRKDFWQTIRKNDFMVFAVVIFVANILIYWASPGAKQRYVYPLYPFFLMVLVYSWQHRHELAPWRTKALRIIGGIMIGMLAVGSLGLNVVPDFEFLDYMLPLSIVAFLVLGATLYFFIKNPKLTLPILILTTIMARILFDLTVIPQRAYQSEAQRDRKLAYEVQQIVGDEPLFIYEQGRISLTMVYYLNRLRPKTLQRNYEQRKDSYYFIAKDSLDFPHQSFLDFEYKGQPHLLIKLAE